MINTLKFKDIENLIFVGDIHGNFETLVFDISHKYKLEDSLFIICGDIGMGFHKDNYYLDLFKHLNNRLLDKRNHIIMFRGNHDEPEIFNDTERNQLFNRETNLHIVPDYSVIEVFKPNTELIANILCIGGATSIDRVRRLAHKQIQADIKIYWENELPFLDLDKLREINEKYLNNIQIIASHTCPSFVFPTTKEGLKAYAKIDITLEATVDKERNIMDNIFWQLKDKQNKISNWYYGHYHTHNLDIKYGINFILCDCNKFYEFKY